MRPSLLIAAITAACASQTVAKGINCEGSGWCTSAGTGVAAALTDLIMTIDDSRWYSTPSLIEYCHPLAPTSYRSLTSLLGTRMAST